MDKKTNISLLECFMRGETSPDEEQILFDWLHSPEAKEQLSIYYQKTWQNYGSPYFYAQRYGHISLRERQDRDHRYKG